MSPPSAPIPSPQHSSSSLSLFPLLSTIEAPHTPLLSFANSGGLGVEYSYSRQRSMYSPSMNLIRLHFRNHISQPLYNVSMKNVSKDTEVEVVPFPEISQLTPNATADVNMHVEFGLTTQPLKFDICCSQGAFPVSLTPAVGELLRPLDLTSDLFSVEEGKLQGLHEHSTKFKMSSDPNPTPQSVAQRLLSYVNVAYVPPKSEQSEGEDSILRFAGRTAKGDLPVLVVVEIPPDLANTQCKARVHCENMKLCGLLMEAVKAAVS
mmetsp:Transcript_47345/g.78857  ORF Transcript_47345/g.78857 Transcript_47345/m.78857 type:complete len:264 (+) Transcript_47345:2-793(+)